MLEITAISMVLKDSGAMQKHGCIITVVYLNNNHRQENVFGVLTNILAKTVPNV
jgi:hypothetical protein